MKTFVREGNVLTVTAPAAVASGDGVQVGSALFGVAVTAIASGASGEIATEGVFTLAKTTGQAYAVGDIVYWNSTTNKLTATSTGNLQVALAVAAAASTATTAQVKLA